MQQSTFSSKSNVCEGKTIRIIAEEPESPGILRLCQKAKIYKGLQSPKYKEKLKNARLCNNDKSALYLPRQCLRNGGQTLDFIGFLGWKHRIYTLFTPLEDRIDIVRTGKA